MPHWALLKVPQKEVERRRRENINDGINEIARLVPGGSEKMGKGMLLRRAADYLSDIANKMGRFDEELASKDREKQTIQVGVAKYCSRSSH